MDEEKNESGMAEAFYDYLMKRTYGNTRRIDQYEIWTVLRAAGFKINWCANQNQHNDHCRKLKDLVDEINFSQDFEMFVSAEDYKYRIATSDEVFKLIQFYHDKAIAAWKRYRKVMAKARKDGQGKLFVDAKADAEIAEEPAFFNAFNKKPEAPSTPKEKQMEQVLVTFDEEGIAGMHYDTTVKMTVPICQSDAETEENIRKRIAPRPLIHWRRI